ncbi:hypothetical protein FQR65_LT07380 [Abscondita terminalis]|nr:hypothetical protein FQR65_LT07380 [Abscondita terminalis]
MLRRVLSEAIQETANKELNETLAKREDSVKEIEKWLHEHPQICIQRGHLWLLNYIRGCEYNIEKVKEMLTVYAKLEELLPELVCNRDPSSLEVQDVIENGIFITFGTPDVDCILLRWESVDSSKTSFYSLMKVGIMLYEIFLNESETFMMVGQIVIIDCKNTKFSSATLCSPTTLKKILHYTFTSFPMRIRHMYFINCSRFFHLLFNIFKHFFPRNIQSKCSVYGTNYTDIYNKVPQQYFPGEYEGSNDCFHDIISDWKTRLEILSVVIAIAVAKPSGYFAPHVHSLGYSSPLHETIIAGPSVVHHDAAILHHPVHETIVAEAPAVVHHKSIVADIPTAVSHQHSSVVHHSSPAIIHEEAIVEPAVHAYVAHSGPSVVHHEYAHAAPAVVHHEISHAAPAVVHQEYSLAGPAVYHQEFAPAVVAHSGPAVVSHGALLHHGVAHAAKSVVAHGASGVVHQEVVHSAPVVHQQIVPAVVHQKSVIADVPVAVSEQHSTVVHKSAPIHHTIVAEAPVVHQAIVPAVHQAVVAEPIAVKQTVSHQDASVVHSAAIHHEVPAVHQVDVYAAPISSQYHAQDTLGQYSFGYSSPLSSKAEVKTLDGITKGEFNYLDSYGKEQSVKYEADAVHGFRASASNLPVGPAPVADTPEVAAAKAAHLSALESAKASIAAAKSAPVASKVVTHEVEAVAPVVPKAFSYSFVAQQPVHVASGFVHDVPVVGISHDTIAVDAKIVPTAYAHHVGVVPGLKYKSASIPVESSEAAHAKTSHFAAFRAGAHLKDEKPCD